MTKRSPLKGLRAIAGTTLFFFIFSTLSWALPEGGLVVALKPEVPSAFLQIEIPDELASIDEVYEAPARNDSKLLLHVQDIHASYEAQVQIHKLLEYLREKYGFQLFFAEGAIEDLNPDYLRLFPEKERNLRVADYLTKRGELTGIEYFLLQSPDQVEAVGIEKAELYRQNYEAFRTIYSQEAEIKQELAAYSSRLELLSSRFFSADLRRLLQDWKKFEDGHRDFLPYLHQLAQDAKKILGLDLESLFAQVEWPHITRLLVIQGMEKELNEAQAKKEKETLITFLKEKKISAETIEAIGKLGEKRVVLNKLDEKNRRLEDVPRYLLERLAEEAGPKGFYFHDYPAFSLQAGYLILQSELDSRLLFEEIEKVFQKILDELAQSEQERNLLELYKDLALFVKLYALELTRKEWDRIQYRKDWVKPDAFKSRLEKMTVELGPALGKTQPLPQAPKSSVHQLFETACTFYEFARKREAAFYDKIQNTMVNRNVEKAVLVTGGFHTDGIAEILREKSVNYGVLTPRLRGAVDTSNYTAVMMERHHETFEVNTIPPPKIAQAPDALIRQGIKNINSLEQIVEDAYRRHLKPGETYDFGNTFFKREWENEKNSKKITAASTVKTQPNQSSGAVTTTVSQPASKKVSALSTLTSKPVSAAVRSEARKNLSQSQVTKRPIQTPAPAKYRSRQPNHRKTKNNYVKVSPSNFSTRSEVRSKLSDLLLSLSQPVHSKIPVSRRVALAGGAGVLGIAAFFIGFFHRVPSDSQTLPENRLPMTTKSVTEKKDEAPINYGNKIRQPLPAPSISREEFDEAYQFAKQKVQSMKNIVWDNGAITEDDLGKPAKTIKRTDEEFYRSLKPRGASTVGYIGNTQNLTLQIMADYLTFKKAGLDPSAEAKKLIALYEAMEERSYGKWTNLVFDGQRLQIYYPEIEARQSHASPFYGPIGQKFGDKGSPDFPIRNKSNPGIHVTMNAEQIHLFADFLFLEGQQFDDSTGAWQELEYRANAGDLASVFAGKAVPEVSYEQVETLAPQYLTPEELNRSEARSTDFNLDAAAVEYTVNVFRWNSERKNLPGPTELSKAFGPHQGTISRHLPNILEALKARIRQRDIGSDVRKRIANAIPAFEQTIENRAKRKKRKEVETFRLDKVVEYIVKVFEKDSQRIELVDQTELSDVLGPSQMTFSRNFSEVLEALKLRIRKRDINSDVRKRITSAIKQFEQKKEDRKESNAFNLDATVEYIVNIFSQDSRRLNLPSQTELATALGPHFGTISRHFPELLKALDSRIRKRDMDSDVRKRIRTALDRSEVRKALSLEDVAEIISALKEVDNMRDAPELGQREYLEIIPAVQANIGGKMTTFPANYRLYSEGGRFGRTLALENIEVPEALALSLEYITTLMNESENLKARSGGKLIETQLQFDPEILNAENQRFLESILESLPDLMERALLLFEVSAREKRPLVINIGKFTLSFQRTIETIGGIMMPTVVYPFRIERSEARNMMAVLPETDFINNMLQYGSESMAVSEAPRGSRDIIAMIAGKGLVVSIEQENLYEGRQSRSVGIKARVRQWNGNGSFLQSPIAAELDLGKKRFTEGAASRIYIEAPALVMEMAEAIDAGRNLNQVLSISHQKTSKTHQMGRLKPAFYEIDRHLNMPGTAGNLVKYLLGRLAKGEIAATETDVIAEVNSLMKKNLVGVNIQPLAKEVLKIHFWRSESRNNDEYPRVDIGKIERYGNIKDPKDSKLTDEFTVPLNFILQLNEDFDVRIHLAEESQNQLRGLEPDAKIIYEVEGRGNIEISRSREDKSISLVVMRYEPEQERYKATLEKIKSWFEGIEKGGLPFNMTHPVFKRSEVRQSIAMEEIISALELNRAQIISETDGPENTRVHRVQIPERDQSISLQGLQVLHNELAQRESVSRYEFLYNSKGDLLGIFPILTPEQKARLGMGDVRYFKFAYFLSDIPQPGEMKDGDAEAYWRRIQEEITQNEILIKAYRDFAYGAEFSNKVTPTFMSDQPPFVYAEINLATGEPSFKGFYPASFDAEKLNQKKDGFYQMIFPVLPTVYSPSIHRRADKIYMDNILDEDFGLDENHDLLVVGPGSGIELVIASLRVKKRIYAVGINPLEIANTKILARLANIEIEALIHDNIIKPDGTPAFPGRTFDRIMWNMQLVQERPLPGLQGNWDGDNGETLRLFAQGLALISNPAAKARVWNAAHFENMDYAQAIMLNDPQLVDQDGIAKVFKSAGMYQLLRPTNQTPDIFSVIAQYDREHYDQTQKNLYAAYTISKRSEVRNPTVKETLGQLRELVESVTPGKYVTKAHDDEFEELIQQIISKIRLTANLLIFENKGKSALYIPDSRVMIGSITEWANLLADLYQKLNLIATQKPKSLRVAMAAINGMEEIRGAFTGDIFNYLSNGMKTEQKFRPDVPIASTEASLQIFKRLVLMTTYTLTAFEATDLLKAYQRLHNESQLLKEEIASGKPLDEEFFAIKMQEEIQKLQDAQAILTKRSIGLIINLSRAFQTFENMQVHAFQEKILQDFLEELNKPSLLSNYESGLRHPSLDQRDIKLLVSTLEVLAEELKNLRRQYGNEVSKRNLINEVDRLAENFQKLIRGVIATFNEEMTSVKSNGAYDGQLIILTALLQKFDLVRSESRDIEPGVLTVGDVKIERGRITPGRFQTLSSPESIPLETSRRISLKLGGDDDEDEDEKFVFGIDFFVRTPFTTVAGLEGPVLVAVGSTRGILGLMPLPESSREMTAFALEIEQRSLPDDVRRMQAAAEKAAVFPPSFDPGATTYVTMHDPSGHLEKYALSSLVTNPNAAIDVIYVVQAGTDIHAVNAAFSRSEQRIAGIKDMTGKKISTRFSAKAVFPRHLSRALSESQRRLAGLVKIKKFYNNYTQVFAGTDQEVDRLVRDQSHPSASFVFGLAYKAGDRNRIKYEVTSARYATKYAQRTKTGQHAEIDQKDADVLAKPNAQTQVIYFIPSGLLTKFASFLQDLKNVEQARISA